MAKETKKQEASAPKAGAAIVKETFRDKDNFERKYEVGEDVSYLDADRISTLVEKGLVEVKGEETESETPNA